MCEIYSFVTKIHINITTILDVTHRPVFYLKGDVSCRSMGFADYVTVYVQLYCVSCYCLTLQVSAYMAIFRCVGYFYFHINEEKHKWKRAECNHVQKNPAKQSPLGI
jgi:hypothetical protein